MLVERRVIIPYASFPHIIEAILWQADYKTLHAIRSTCSSLKTAAHKVLWDGTVRVRMEERTPVAEQALTLGSGLDVVLRSGVGVLPVLEDKWAATLALACTVDVDSGCLGPSTMLTSEPHYGRVAELVRLDVERSWRRLALNAALRSALNNIPSSADVVIKHIAAQPNVAYLPPSSHLTVVLDPLCNCARGLPASHSARHVSLLHTSDWDDRVDEFTTRFCGVACAAVSPSVQLLTISAISLRHIRFTVNAIALHAPRPHKSFKVQIRLRQSLEEEHGSAIRDLVSAKLGIHAESVFIIQDDDAGVIVD
ncbi:hypothetical protein A1Q1_07225 [Trichosporon asahii var. asahii CBS 2479]|uniref:Uncharacterized protein n=1 Tax=Trichosporon asahii var. asahii (strain ATCC 90039 / CBS 2479 / JCM 2466 / KCTC 7840 / NBRC 103889/ NCYC 2677 / UAMH 7654) TaxID=1186058 RepID=J5RAG5_TRIAS|nr:hypothetical protein A1Q1_07225 [Trichosporon asahii var. asahii CBS 2479]EJT51558.1 hypothetical protein A1Q1_07225 [Trichosporon asahii var. asahii CBS 2479]